MVQSTMKVRDTSRNTPVKRPAWRKAYGCPIIPAPLINRQRLSTSQLLSRSPESDSHYTVSHIHKGASHPTLWPRAFQKILRTKPNIGARNSDSSRLHIPQQPDPLPFFTIIPSTQEVLFLDPICAIPRGEGTDRRRIIELYSIWCPRGAIRSLLRKATLSHRNKPGKWYRIGRCAVARRGSRCRAREDYEVIRV